MLVHYVTDTPTKIPAIRAMLEPRYIVRTQVLGNSETEECADSVVMIDADLRQQLRVDQIRTSLGKLGKASEKLFVVRNDVRSMVSQAYALGATAVVSRPREIISKLAEIETASTIRHDARPMNSQAAIDGGSVMAAMFRAIQSGVLVNVKDAERAPR